MSQSSTNTSINSILNYALLPIALVKWHQIKIAVTRSVPLELEFIIFRSTKESTTFCCCVISIVDWVESLISGWMITSIFIFLFLSNEVNILFMQCIMPSSLLWKFKSSLHINAIEKWTLHKKEPSEHHPQGKKYIPYENKSLVKLLERYKLYFVH